MARRPTMTNPTWRITTARLDLTPVGGADLADLVALKGDPLAYASMLGGVRGPMRVADELAADIVAWGRDGFGIWAVRARGSGAFLGMAGLATRADGRGVALRFALWPHVRGAGLAREAAIAALRYGHGQAGLSRIVAVSRADNFASRTLLGAIGMVEIERFLRDRVPMLVFQSMSA